ncbi:MAG TPA: UvrB/UvrC motif-containing protein [Coprobacillaceae bacterium]|nr:UvrB/UvrC motif-containing protein [Coprobacillaceae bacterium]
MNQCLGPCVNEVSEEKYKKITKQITQFIQGDTKEIIDDLQDKMMQASEILNFELAKEYRDLIHYIHHVTSKQHVQFSDQIDRDIFGYYQDKGYLSLQLFFMRNGKLLARDLNLVPLQDANEQITQFIVGFYQENTYPKEILLPEDLDTTLLEEILECNDCETTKRTKS